MVAGVIAQKSDQWFNLADVDGNGYIEEVASSGWPSGR